MTKVAEFDAGTSRTDGHIDWRYAWRQPRRALRQFGDTLVAGAAQLEQDDSLLPPGVQEVLRRFDEASFNAGCADKHEYGGRWQSERVAAMADLSLEEHPGDIVEIGCCAGVTTKLLAEVASRRGRRVIAIDPWIPGTQNCDGGEYEVFLRNIEPWKAAVDIWKASSLALETTRRLAERKLAFAFVDGLHTYEACRSDFAAVSHAEGLIVADDMRYNREVCLALRLAAHRLGRRVFQVPRFREGLMLPR
jgi:hypothetical protein